MVLQISLSSALPSPSSQSLFSCCYLLITVLFSTRTTLIETAVDKHQLEYGDLLICLSKLFSLGSHNIKVTSFDTLWFVNC